MYIQSWHRRRAKEIGEYRWRCNTCTLKSRRRSVKMLNAQGYVRVSIQLDDPLIPMAQSRGPFHAYVLEHRLVVARWLGRPLLASEQVHHRNGNKQDNRLENLELWNRRQPTGVRAADYHCAGCTCFGGSVS
jgi:hypothetical protein